jgi:hypothetical protein
LTAAERDIADNPDDPVGCTVAILRLGCGTALLWVIMFLAIVAVALVSLLFFR